VEENVPATFDPGAHPVLAGLGPRLRELAGDSSYAAGLTYFRKGVVKHGAVAGTTAYATVTGSTDYRVTVAFGEEPLRVTCTCPAYRRNKHCKHVVAVCVTLLQRPESFAVGQAPPQEVQAPKARRVTRRMGAGASTGEKAGAKKAGAKTGARAKAVAPETGTLRAAGLETVDRLLADLTDGGLLGLGAEKLTLLAGAAELVRGLKLRRLGNLLMSLQRRAQAMNGASGASGANRARSGPGRPAGGDGQALDAGTFARLLADIYLTRRATATYLAGEEEDGRPDESPGPRGPGAVDPQAAEDLLGKTWRDEELEPVGGLELIELASRHQDDGEFRVETSYLADVATGDLFLETQISPTRLAGKPKPGHRFRLLVEDGALYPGPPPRRLKLRRLRRSPLRQEDVERLLARAPASVGELRRRLVERLASPFGEAAVPVLFRPAALVAAGERLGATDAAGELIPLVWPSGWRETLPPLLPPPGDFVLFGLLRLEAGGPVLECRAVAGAGLRWLEGPVFPEVAP
jgi:hypothetical protein